MTLPLDADHLMKEDVIDRRAGIVLHKACNDRTCKGDVLCTLYASGKNTFKRREMRIYQQSRNKRKTIGSSRSLFKSYAEYRLKARTVISTSVPFFAESTAYDSQNSPEFLPLRGFLMKKWQKMEKFFLQFNVNYVNIVEPAY